MPSSLPTLSPGTSQYDTVDHDIQFQSPVVRGFSDLLPNPSDQMNNLDLTQSSTPPTQVPLDYDILQTTRNMRPISPLSLLEDQPTQLFIPETCTDGMAFEESDHGSSHFLVAETQSNPLKVKLVLLVYIDDTGHDTGLYWLGLYWLGLYWLDLS
jgi:hypothetical protein